MKGGVGVEMEYPKNGGMEMDDPKIISQKSVFFEKNAIREGAKNTPKGGGSANNGDVGSFRFLKLILGGEYEISFFGRGA